MKTIEKLENALNQRREQVTLCLVLIFILAYAFGCKKEMEEVPVEEMEVNADQAITVPDWAPEGANPDARYYYLPAAEVYYDAYVGQYVYLKDGRWVYGVHLPHVYASIDLYTTPIVFLNIGVVHPWLRHDFYVGHYPKHMPKGWAHGYSGRFWDENGKHPYPKNGFYPGGPKKHVGPFPSTNGKHDDQRRLHSPIAPHKEGGKMNGGHQPSGFPSHFPNTKPKNMKPISGSSSSGAGQMAPSHSKPSQGGTKSNGGGKPK